MNKFLKSVLVTWLLLSSQLAWSDTLIKNVKLANQNIDSAATVDVMINDSTITAVGSDLNASQDTVVIDGAGKVLTAGFFNANTELGVREVGAVAGTVDSSSLNARVTSALQVADAVNPDSVLIPHNRSYGLTHALVVPSAGASMFSGTAALIQMSAKGTVVKDAVAQVVRLGSATSELNGGSRAASMALLREAFDDARDYQRNRGSYNAGSRRDYPMSRLDLEALWPVLDGSMPLLVFVDRASDIRQVLSFAKKRNIKLILAGVTEGWRVADEIAAAKVPVIMDPIENLPASYDSLGSRLENAAQLHEAGVTLLFTGMSWHRTHNAYLVRQSAGNAISNGLPYDAALAAVTTNPAKVFGLKGQGEVKQGATANLVLWNGDPFETQTTVAEVFIDGERQSLVNRGTRLRDRYFSRLQSN